MEKQNSEQLKRLVKEARSGSKEAFGMIFEQLSDEFFAYAVSRTSNRDNALDIVQEAFVDLWKSLKKFKYRSRESFYGFIFTIIKRKIFRYYKSKKNNLPLDGNAANESYETDYQDHRYLFKQINLLKENYQDILRLHYWSDMTFAQIASALNIKETTAKVWHHRALEKLKINIDKQKYVL